MSFFSKHTKRKYNEDVGVLKCMNRDVTQAIN